MGVGMIASARRRSASAPIGATVTLTTADTSPWTVLAGWGAMKVECIGAGGNGSNWASAASGNGGGGGQYQSRTSVPVTAGSSIAFHVGVNGGSRGSSGAPGTADTYVAPARA